MTTAAWHGISVEPWVKAAHEEDLAIQPGPTPGAWPTIRELRGRLERGLVPTPGQVERWNRLVEHDRHDCAGMRRVCLRATRELDAAG